MDIGWAPDPELDAAEAELYRLDPTGDRVVAVLRETFDQLYDGQHTGRWNFNDLHKTEKTHMAPWSRSTCIASSTSMTATRRTIASPAYRWTVNTR